MRKEGSKIAVPGEHIASEAIVKLLVESGIVISPFGIIFFTFVGEGGVDGVHCGLCQLGLKIWTWVQFTTGTVCLLVIT
jgi:hypothetical protein